MVVVLSAKAGTFDVGKVPIPIGALKDVDAREVSRRVGQDVLEHPDGGPPLVHADFQILDVGLSFGIGVNTFCQIGMFGENQSTVNS